MTIFTPKINKHSATEVIRNKRIQKFCRQDRDQPRQPDHRHRGPQRLRQIQYRGCHPLGHRRTQDQNPPLR